MDLTDSVSETVRGFGVSSGGLSEEKSETDCNITCNK